jgi:hypothetical protein
MRLRKQPLHNKHGGQTLRRPQVSENSHQYLFSLTAFLKKKALEDICSSRALLGHFLVLSCHV